MPMSPYLASLRTQIGHALLMVPAVVARIRDETGRLLMVELAGQGRWGLPGGAIEPGEPDGDEVSGVRYVHASEVEQLAMPPWGRAVVPHLFG